MAVNPEITADEADRATIAPEALSPQARLLAAFNSLPMQRKIMLLAAVAAIIAVLVGFWLWNRQPDYGVLFANFSEKDGGAIIAALDQANVPYRYSPGGAAILVPSGMVHDTRLRLASQGLPRGGSVGFELMENQRFGVSQFIEQVNYQRALEGELARTIQSISAVDSARVHLAIPRPSVFVREEQRPTASVLLHLYPGTTLDNRQLAGVAHLVASSVPQMPIANVNIVDQHGALLSQPKDKQANAGLDPTQLMLVREAEKAVIERIRDILHPLMGEGNYRVQVAADLDFSHIEQTARTFSPNTTPHPRSVQQSETVNAPAAPKEGVPGALTNQPPVPAIAPITQPPVPVPPGEAGAEEVAAQGAFDPNNPYPGRIVSSGIDTPMSPITPPVGATRDTTTNYELDEIIRYVRQAPGAVRRLTAAVVVNYRPSKNPRTGEERMEPFPENELRQIENLVREAMGYNGERGDSLSVANAPFTPEVGRTEERAFWKEPENVTLGLKIMQYLVIAGIIFAIYFVMIRPALRAMSQLLPKPTKETRSESAEWDDEEEASRAEIDNFTAKLERAREIAATDPKIVANTINDWLGANAS
ncbi:MAG: flagellar M-ring protein FliF [Betaproteobacteria bacterium]|nr:flagellar M-ring protein FliF [Betaproteobacteria bacterium]